MWYVTKDGYYTFLAESHYHSNNIPEVSNDRNTAEKDSQNWHRTMLWNRVTSFAHARSRNPSGSSKVIGQVQE